MAAIAAVTSGSGAGAVSTIQLFGKQAKQILRPILQGADIEKLVPGDIRIGRITEEGQVLDEVMIGCEGQDQLTIHCHGNPLIVSAIMDLLAAKGAEPVTFEQMTQAIHRNQKANSIQIEKQIALTNAKTLQAARIITNFAQKTDNWQGLDHDQIRIEAAQILKADRSAKVILEGAKIVLTGQPNSGKSTLFNALCGRNRAIVTNISGTTRDWISAEIEIGSAVLNFVDTAGLDKNLELSGGDIDRQSQQKSRQLLAEADMILLVIDAAAEINKTAIEQFLKDHKQKEIMVILNKQDIGFKDNYSPAIPISAKTGHGLNNLIAEIGRRLGIIETNQKNLAACFTKRQKKLLRAAIETKTPDRLDAVLDELFNGELTE